MRPGPKFRRPGLSFYVFVRVHIKDVMPSHPRVLARRSFRKSEGPSKQCPAQFPHERVKYNPSVALGDCETFVRCDDQISATKVIDLRSVGHDPIGVHSIVLPRGIHASFVYCERADKLVPHLSRLVCDHDE